LAKFSSNLKVWEEEEEGLFLLWEYIVGGRRKEKEGF
jgi:hypothetical protein